MSDEFNITSKLFNHSVQIGTIDLPLDSVVSVEVYFRNDTPKVLCTLIINDIFDMSSYTTWRDQVVTIYYEDIFNNSTKKEYVVLHVEEEYNNIKEKVITLELQDTFSFALEHTFTSKGFITNPILALRSYIDDYLKLTYVSDTTSELDFTAWAGADYSFTVPNNINILDWFLSEFTRHGYTFYQTKTKICVKSLKDLLPSTLPLNDDTHFTNETNNQLYKNFIHEVKTVLNNRSAILPKTKTLFYDQNKKIMETYEINDAEQYTLNDDVFNLQQNFGFKNEVQQHLNFDNHEIKLKNSFLKQSMLHIFVPGFIKNDINQIYDIKLSGNKGITKSQVSGNIVIGGKYISCSCADKLFGDSLIQKIVLCRADLTKKL